MPRLVDHDERRTAIIRATWELIAEKGIDATSMRDIAHASGYANAGTLSHYFTDKSDLLQRAYEYVYEATNDRIATAGAGAEGIDAIRSMAREIAPLDPVTLHEASIALSFWQRALHDRQLAGTSRSAISGWRDRLVAHLGDARRLGQVRSKTPDVALADQLLAMLFGMHVTGLLDEQVATVERQATAIESFLNALAD
ncbi:TetR/AcrR family transcriptional regulator [Diaminobutyricibacter sp. McL0618]|uniref:TetR/AcrR family transcriptional regulator n=1 Tax=Leifsonia sp. McL0618 TaxID=3415677 RepID=UPI003CF92278